MTYAQAKERALQLEAEHSRAGRALRALSGGGPMGLTPDAVRATPEWKAAKKEATAAFAALRAFNAVFVKQFGREIREERRQRREGLEAAPDAPAYTTWAQIPYRAKVMLGARQAIASENGQTISFKITRNAKTINWIRIRLDPNDTYTLQFGRGLKSPKVVAQEDGVYFDQLLPTIEEHTGLDTGGIR